MSVEQRIIRVTGTVQGVGFRPFVHRQAVGLGLTGQVANDGAAVVIHVRGPAPAIDELVRRIRSDPPPMAEVFEVDVRPVPLVDHTDFRIADSIDVAPGDVAVTPDVATCPACLTELWDESDRRHGHPFITCTDCGPRYTIIRRLPFDRKRTTMAPFPLCADCRREYDDPSDRRFHAESICCRECGPQLELLDAQGTQIADGDAALEQTVAMLAKGAIVAVKGLGGFHLAVDATDDEAVRRLRKRKARDEKPFAVMVPDVEAAHAFCELDVEGSAELASPRRPIVLAARREGGGLSESIAPGLSELGMMLPYTPLHHLLLRGVGRPLVMTSGNRSDEAIVHRDAEAVVRLGGLADVLLVHDRAIHIRCDDSVVRCTGNGLQVLRRSRGHAPSRIELPVGTEIPLLAVGAQLKNTVAVAAGQHLVASHHLGDLEHLDAYQAFEQAIEHLSHLTGIDPQIVVHDLHPEYLSTKWAADRGLPTLAVQHHHAHVASCMVEHGRQDPVLGVAFDGLGLGADGTLWGGEFLVADLGSYERAGHLLPVAQPGGTAAIREPWRMALVWLDAALGAEVAARYGRSVDDRWEAVRDLAGRELTNTTTSVGRLFDAVAALSGLRTRVSYEGQAAIELESVAAGISDDSALCDRAEVDIDDGVVVLDPRPLLRRLWTERVAGTSPAVMSAGFHTGLGDAVVQASTLIAERHGLDAVALTGGVFQNRRLSRIVERGLRRHGLDVLVHARIPPNDGGISAGQAAIAAASCAGTAD